MNLLVSELTVVSTDMEYLCVASIGDIPLRKTLAVEIAGTEVLVCHTAEGFFAINNTCSHAAASLAEGKLKGHRILCPLHGAAFDVRDGKALSRPASVPLACYPVRVEGEDILVGVRPSSQ